jgi:hypothetical protein
LAMAARFATPEKVAFALRNTAGWKKAQWWFVPINLFFSN